jgi:hypothetical protein
MRMQPAVANSADWKKSTIHVFWGEIAPYDHLVQFYENEDVFMNTLEGFAGDGFIKNETVIMIATKKHLDLLSKRLSAHGFKLPELRKNGQYIPVNAELALTRFMVNDWPDEELFRKFVDQLISKAGSVRKIRAFGEMVALLWEKGNNGATVKLEHLWHNIHQNTPFCLYCAYPRSGFTQHPVLSIQSICKAHSKIIDGNPHPTTEVYYSTADNHVKTSS